MYERGVDLASEYPGWEHRASDEHALWWFFMFLVFALLVGLVAALAMRWLSGRQQVAAAPAAAFAAGPADEALSLVRMRYARGEIDREQYLQASADLGGQPPPTQSPPAQPPAAQPPPTEWPQAEPPDETPTQ
jgi:putative membrane protein